jgi:hypothetical protein
MRTTVQTTYPQKKYVADGTKNKLNGNFNREISQLIHGTARVEDDPDMGSCVYIDYML